MTQNEVIIEALEALGGDGTIKEVSAWMDEMYPNRWKDYGTAMADMVPVYLGGNSTSNVKDELRILERMAPGRYRLIYK
jgi:hypothetical protein